MLPSEAGTHYIGAAVRVESVKHSSPCGIPTTLERHPELKVSSILRPVATIPEGPHIGAAARALVPAIIEPFDLNSH